MVINMSSDDDYTFVALLMRIVTSDGVRFVVKVMTILIVMTSMTQWDDEYDWSGVGWLQYACVWWRGRGDMVRDDEVRGDVKGDVVKDDLVRRWGERDVVKGDVVRDDLVRG